MLKYLVGTFNESEAAFTPPYRIVHAVDRDAACSQYNERFGNGRVLALMSLCGPVCRDKYCTHAAAVAAVAEAEEMT